ncbi:MAG: transcriptional regulator, TetR family [Labilithrix sp.]|nr:transcriptional regulator, TetR family [Labilithrix sp.]
MSRPKAFDEQEALDAAMRVFWRQGYEGTSLSDLTAAMGINRPSLYATFGNKEALFRRAVERYLAGPGAAIMAALEQPTAREAVAELLRIHVEAPGEQGRPLGCLMINAGLGCSMEAEPLRDELAKTRQASVVALRKRLERAQREGDLPAGAKPGALAFFVWTVLHGISVQAVSGATRAQLREAAALAMRAWPAADA